MKRRTRLWVYWLVFLALMMTVAYILFREEITVIIDGKAGKIYEAFNTVFLKHPVYLWGAIILGAVGYIFVAAIPTHKETVADHRRLQTEKNTAAQFFANIQQAQVSVNTPQSPVVQLSSYDQNHLAYIALEHNDRGQKLAAAQLLTDGLLCLGVVIGTHDVGVLNIVKDKADISGENRDILKRYLACQEQGAPMTDGLRNDMAHAYKRVFAADHRALIVRGYWRSAETSLLNAVDKAPGPERKIEALYDLGVLNWSFLGRGEQALEAFERVWQLWSGGAAGEQSRMIASNASENAMILSPSAEEFIAWGERLRSISPELPILSEIGRTFPERYENGTPWWECMSELANGLYNRNDPANDSGRYGNGASIWRIMLINRKKLRLPAEAWRNAAQEYGILSLRLLAVEARKTGNWWCTFDGYETAYPVYEAHDLVEEYVKAYPGGVIETDIFGDMKKNIALGNTDFDRLWKGN